MGFFLRREGPREECAAGESQLGARFERGRLRRHIAALFGGTLIEITVAAQPANGTLVNTLHDTGDVLFGVRLRFEKSHSAALHFSKTPSAARV